MAGRIAASVAVLLVVGLAAITCVLLSAAHRADAVARSASRQMTEAAVISVLSRLGRAVSDYAGWDPMVDPLHGRFVSEGQKPAVIEQVAMLFRLDGVFVLDPGGRVTFAYSGGDNDPSVTPQAAEFLAAVARLARTQQDPTAVAAGFTTMHGEPHAVAARRMSRIDDGRRADGEPSVLVFTASIKERLLDHLEIEHQLASLRLSPTPAAGDGEVALPLPAVLGGEAVGYLVWQPQLPGRQMLRDLAAPAGVAVVLMVGLFVRIVGSARRAGRALDDASCAIARSRAELEMTVAQRTAALRQAEARLRGIFEHAAEGIFQVRPDGRYLSANPAMARMLGYDSPEELIAFGTDHHVLADPQRRAEFLAAIESHGEVRDFVSQAQRRDGRIVWMSQNAHGVRDADGRLLMIEGMIVDITARKSAEDKLLHDAHHDVLTGLPNRTLFLQRLSQALHRGALAGDRSFAVLMLDCDRFKLINDSYGHAIGDDLLVALAQRLAGCMRRTDMLARLGGDEFAVLVEDPQAAAAAAAVAERLHQACRTPFLIHGRQITATLSIGVAADRERYRSADEVMRDADTAMYQAKARGRGRTEVFERGMHLSVAGRLKTETELRLGLEYGEFVVHYQPIVALATGELAGFEALARWQHPERGLVPPGEFIPVAEDCGLIQALGDVVLEQAAAQMVGWLTQAAVAASRLFVSVNLSPQQLTDPRLVEKITSILDKTGLPGKRLKLELTETAIMADPATVLSTLSALASLGIRLCIDDFGTGYSSLSHLSTFPVETLKIDRSFVARLTAGRQHVEIVRTILTLADTLRLTIVAEGIESPLQLQWLRASRCGFGQGYLISRPVDAAAATALVADSSALARVIGQA